MTISRTICLGFVAVITIGTLLLMLPISTADGQWNNWIVALFTSTSAVCVTGLVVVDTGTHFSGWGQFFIMLLIQVGGLGYMTITTFLILMVKKRFDLRSKIAIQQALDRTGLHDSANIIRAIIYTTLVFELGGAILLSFVFLPQYGWYGLWMSLFHSVSAWNNAGFGLLSDNLVQYQTSILVNLVISGLIIFGGFGYQAILELWGWIKSIRSKNKLYSFSLHFKVVSQTTIFLLLFGTLALIATEWYNPDVLNSAWGNNLLIAWFQSVSTRTAGFNTVDIGKITNGGLFIMVILMFLGASPGGTGGGIKTTTINVLFNSAQTVLQGKDDVHLFNRRLPHDLIFKAISVMIGSLLVVLFATIILTITDYQVDFMKILFEVVSAFGTVGLSTGITANLSAIAKLILVGVMYIGRVGVLLLVAAIYGDTKPSRINYPEEELLVG